MEKSGSKWVAGWGAAISYVSQNHADYFRDQTFRYVIFPTVDGSAVRLHFSNEYGTEPATVSKVVLAKRDRGEFVFPETNVRVTFGGSGEVTIPAGGSVVSDPAVFPVTAGEEFDVSLYFAGFTQLLTGHSNNGYYIKKYYGKGDWAEKACVPLEEYGENGPYVFLNTIDFLSSSDCHSVIAFGDSITTGFTLPGGRYDCASWLNLTAETLGLGEDDYVNFAENGARAADAAVLYRRRRRP